MFPKCMLPSCWEGKFAVLIFLTIFLISSFFHFCYWFLNSWDTKGTSVNNISVTERLHSSNFVEWYLVHQSHHEFRCSLTLGGLSLQLIDKYPNPCNLLYLTELKDTFWPIYISIADCHFEPEERPVVFVWIPVLLWNSESYYTEPCKNKKLGVWRSC